MKAERLFERMPLAFRHVVARFVWRSFGKPLSAAERAALYRGRRHETVTKAGARPSRNRDADRHETVTPTVTNNRHDAVTLNRDENAEVPPCTPPTRLPKIDSLTSGSPRKSRAKEQSTTPRVQAFTYSEGFLKFWKTYPLRVGKGAAFSSWKKQNLESKSEEIVQAVAARNGFREREGGDYHPPNPATWLNQRRWEDDPPRPPLLADEEPYGIER